VLRHHLGLSPLRPDADALWDSSVVPHDARWSLPLPGRDETAADLRTVRDAVLACLRAGPVSDALAYVVAYTVFHEDMHAEAIASCRIARAPVTAAEFAAFVEDGGYQDPRLWSDAGWGWRLDAGRAFGAPAPAEHPVYWRRGGAGWERRHFDRWVPLEPHHPV